MTNDNNNNREVGVMDALKVGIAVAKRANQGNKTCRKIIREVLDF